MFPVFPFFLGLIFPILVAIRVVAISGFYYAAVAAKLITKGATVYQYLKASRAVDPYP